MQQTIKQGANISSMSTHKLNENMTIKINSNKDSTLKDYQDNIQVRELTHLVERYITVSLYM